MEYVNGLSNFNKVKFHLDIKTKISFLDCCILLPALRHVVRNYLYKNDCICNIFAFLTKLQSSIILKILDK